MNSVYHLILAACKNTQRGRENAQGMGSTLANLFSRSVQKTMQIGQHLFRILIDCPFGRQNSGLRKKFATDFIPA